MKNIIISVLLFTFSQNLTAQVLKQIGERTKQKAKERLERKADQTIDKGLDKAEEGIDNAGKKKEKKKKNTNTPTNDSENTSKEIKANPIPNPNPSSNPVSTNEISKEKDSTPISKVDTKFDFVPGEKIILFEDFNSYPMGSFPKEWASNGTGQIVQMESDKNLQVKKEVVFYPTKINKLPKEFTIEYDLMCNTDFNYYSYEFAVGFTNAKELKNQWNYFGRFGNGGENNSRVEFMLHPNDEGNMQGLSYFISSYNFNERMRNNAQQNLLSIRAGNTKVHVSIWRQDQRVRVYLNDKKVWDIPSALDAGVNINTIYFRSNGTDNETDAYYLDNIKIATGNSDAKNKMITKGNYSTSHILFDLNSDRIKPESYGVLKEIATILNESSHTHFKIIGHTDSDGEEAANMKLSQKRAAAVKQVLLTQFSIDAKRIHTDGKGETQPTVKNDTPENKAQNRRVEFIKL